MHYLLRKKEYERIDHENRKIQRSIDTQRPAIDFDRLERDYKEKHVKVRSLIARNNLMPIESFIKKKMDLINHYGTSDSPRFSSPRKF